jgi:hypothetical protein
MVVAIDGGSLLEAAIAALAALISPRACVTSSGKAPSFLRGRGAAGLYHLVIPNWSGRTACRTSSIRVLCTSLWANKGITV